jgi:hypothetical protein
MKSEILLTLIKEVVKNEVKQQVKEEVAKLIKSGAVTINKQRPQQSTPSLKELTEVDIPTQKQSMVPRLAPKAPIKEFSKDPMINEILSMTQPFTPAHRAEGSINDINGGGSILDALQPQKSMEEDWETMDYRTTNVPQQISSTDNAGADAVVKALTRDYSELVKRFK